MRSPFYFTDESEPSLVILGEDILMICRGAEINSAGFFFETPRTAVWRMAPLSKPGDFFSFIDRNPYGIVNLLTISTPLLSKNILCRKQPCDYAQQHRASDAQHPANRPILFLPTNTHHQKAPGPRVLAFSFGKSPFSALHIMVL